MKKIIALLLALVMLFGATSLLFSCAPIIPVVPGINGPEDGDGNGDEDGGENGEGNGDGGGSSLVVTPPYKDYGRDTVDFDKIVYSEPDVSDMVSRYNTLATSIQDGIDSAIALNVLLALEDEYLNFSTMYSYAEIQMYKDSSSTYWTEQYSKLSSGSIALSQAYENVAVAAANSPDSDYYAYEYFGVELDGYVGGGIYTEEVVALLQRESDMVAEYNSISTSTVEFTASYYDEEFTGTYEEIVAAFVAKYGSSGTAYEYFMYDCDYAYQLAVYDLEKELYIELLKVRRQIADTITKPGGGKYSTYAEYAYESMGYDYTPEDMKAFIRSIGTSIYPVYGSLLDDFVTKFSGSTPSLSPTNLINTLYATYLERDAGLAEAYAYMLQHKLYDVSGSNDNRYDGAFTTYLEANNSPFLFATTYGSVTDYGTMAHEFGHFYDAYVNNNENYLLELCEVSSQALEYLTLAMLKTELGSTSSAYQYLRYNYAYVALTTLLYQGMYSMFEHLAYELPLAEITEEKLNELAAEACNAVTGLSNGKMYIIDENPYTGKYEKMQVEFNDATYMLVPHLIVSPMYVQSYVTSIVPALEIYFMGEEEGLAVYKSLVANAGDYTKSYIEHLSAAGLTSPFADGVLTDLADKILVMVRGTSKTSLNAA